MGGLVVRVERMEEAERGRAEGGAMAVLLWRNLMVVRKPFDL